MLKPLLSLVKLPLKQQAIVFRAWCLFVYWHILIVWVPYRKWRHRLTSQPTSEVALPLSDIYNIIKLSEAAARHHLVKVNCLRRCMVQKSLLNQMGVSTQLAIGVKKVKGIFSAHCWLICNDQVLNDSPEVINEYALLQRISSDMPAADVLQGMF